MGHAALRTVLMMGLFEDWSESETRSVAELARKSGAEESLISTSILSHPQVTPSMKGFSDPISV